MIRSAILSLTAASSMSYAVTEITDTVNKSVQSTAAVYAAAGEILDVNGYTDASAEARMYKAAEGLQPVVDKLNSGYIANQYAQLGN